MAEVTREGRQKHSKACNRHLLHRGNFRRYRRQQRLAEKTRQANCRKGQDVFQKGLHQTDNRSFTGHDLEDTPDQATGKSGYQTTAQTQNHHRDHFDADFHRIAQRRNKEIN